MRIVCVIFGIFVFLGNVDESYCQTTGGNEWSTQQIIGVVFGVISIIGLLVSLICCVKNCYAQKKANRTQPQPEYDNRQYSQHNQNKSYMSRQNEEMGRQQQPAYDYFGGNSYSSGYRSPYPPPHGRPVY